MLTPVILSGGAGTRLWPLSRELYPKQLLPLIGSRTLLQQTLLRLEGLEASPPVIVCNEAHRFLVAEQLRQLRIEPRALVLEPFGRNTAPAIALAALASLKGLGADANAVDPVLIVLPADHVIRDVAAFQRALHTGLAAAEHGLLVTFGVVPTAAETGYGYIQRGAANGAAFRIARFVEKPDAQAARGYVDSGDYYWNSGMFLFRARRYLKELALLQPEMARVCEAAFRDASADLEFTRIAAQAFEACPADSIDYAVMEKTRDAVVVPLEAGWSDVGSWAALHAASTADAHGNVTRGDVVSADSHGCYLYSESRLVAAVGLEDHVVIETKDAVLVVPRSRVQDVKKLVQQLKEAGRYEHSLHREVFRPWGSYDGLEKGQRFQVKRLKIKPGSTLSLQLHHHRAEHWVVVAGTARITRGEEVFLLEENQSTYIPIGVQHRIENPGKIPLEIIEVQSGSYLGEDDIVRLEDKYGRKGTTS
ncbi:MAG TPA: mannose-1-phosphate guanylyltransferase/mannose-6-phosphate isomerase [Steroidobacteraceae bacterium]|jgi:mannose-1-phosphate guanylyltransferase / mannose-6-phosphate isomerase|nr:mannose-1-phosphate guanylyltransferase/mannose-6-phosphate isomerase [Steroidobacteraceae bacterium]